MSVKTLVAAFGVAIAGIVVLVLRNQQPEASVETGTVSSTSPEAATESDSAEAKPRSAGADRLTVEVAPVAAPESRLEEARAADWQRFQSELRQACEASLAGSLDPGAFLDAALLLTTLETDKPIPEATPGGAIRYPLIGAPEGMHAELWIQRTGNPEFDSRVMTLAVSLDPPRDPYLVQGAPRRGSEAQVTVWRDPSGGLARFGVNVNVEPTPSSWLFEQANLPQGSLFAYDPKKPFEWTAKTLVLDHGFPVETDQGLAVQGVWPRTDDLDRLNQGLEHLFNRL